MLVKFFDSPEREPDGSFVREMYGVVRVDANERAYRLPVHDVVSAAVSEFALRRVVSATDLSQSTHDVRTTVDLALQVERTTLRPSFYIDPDDETVNRDVAPGLRYMLAPIVTDTVREVSNVDGVHVLSPIFDTLSSALADFGQHTPQFVQGMSGVLLADPQRLAQHGDRTVVLHVVSNRLEQTGDSLNVLAELSDAIAQPYGTYMCPPEPVPHSEQGIVAPEVTPLGDHGYRPGTYL